LRRALLARPGPSTWRSRLSAMGSLPKPEEDRFMQKSKEARQARAEYWVDVIVISNKSGVLQRLDPPDPQDLESEASACCCLPTDGLGHRAMLVEAQLSPAGSRTRSITLRLASSIQSVPIENQGRRRVASLNSSIRPCADLEHVGMVFRPHPGTPGIRWRGHSSGIPALRRPSKYVVS